MRERHPDRSDNGRPTYVEVRREISNASNVFKRQILDPISAHDTLAEMKPSTLNVVAFAALSISAVSLSVCLSDRRGRFSIQSVLVPPTNFEGNVGDASLPPGEPERELVLLDTATGRAWKYTQSYSKTEFRAGWLPMGHTNLILHPYVRSFPK